VAEKIELTAERLRSLLDYDPETGVFTRRVPLTGWKVGSVAGHICPDGYVRIGIDYVSYLSHRLAWYWVTGSWPLGVIDHFNGNKSDNRFANLRDVTLSVNQQNTRKASKNSSSGFLGVNFLKGRWVSRITVNGRYVHIGRFDTAIEAHEAYLDYKRKIHSGCTL